MTRGIVPSTFGRFVWLALATLLLLPCLAPAAAVRAPFVHQSWTVRDGMPVNSVTSLVQSRSGHLWLGTFDGLVRFDGVRFRTYNVGNTPGLAHNRITSVDESADGQLLLGTDAGVLQLLDPAREHAEVLWTTPVNRPNLVWSGPDGTLYASLKPGLGRLVGGRIERLDVEPLPELEIAALAFGPGSTLWLATENAGLWRLSDGRMDQLAPAQDLDIGEIHDLLVVDAGHLWVAGEGGVRRVDSAGAGWLRDGGEEWRVATHVLERDSDGRIVIGAENGVHEWQSGHLVALDAVDPRRSPKNLVLHHGETTWRVSASAVFREIPGPGGAPVEALHRLADIEASRIVHFLVDDSGSAWVATAGAGLHRLRPVAFSVLGEAEGLSAREVYPLHQDAAGTVWIGTQKGGLNRLVDGRVEVFGEDSGLRDDNITAIASDADGTLWVATHEAGLFRRGAAEFVSEPDPRLARARIRALHLDGRGLLWAGADTGLFLRDPDLGWQRHAASDALAGCTTRVIRDDPQALWIGTDRCGAYRIAVDQGGKQRQAEPVPGSRFIRDIHLIDPGNLWLASEDRGLIRVYQEPDALRAVPVQARHGLPGDGAHQILADGHGWFWVSTNQGIYRTRLEALEAVAAALREGTSPPVLVADRFGESDGMRSREANGGVHSSAIRTAAGELWFATQDGVAIVDPRPGGLLRQPRPVIESVGSGDERWALVEVLTLAAAQRSFHIDFTELRQMEPVQTRLRYRLLGHDEDWVEAGELRRAHYTRVPPGSYEFRVEGWTGSGWSSHGASLRLTVLPYLHETASFRALFLCVVALLLWLAYRARVGRLQAQRRELQRQVAQRTEQLARGKEHAEQASRLIAAQAEQLREVDRQKSRFFDDLAHELRTPLTLILGPLRDLQRAQDAAPPAIEGAIRNGEVLLDLTNQLLDLARLEAGKLELDRQRQDLTALLRASAARFRPLALSRGVGLRLRLPVAPCWALLDPRHAGKIFDNLLSNAFKFTEAGGLVDLSLQVGDGNQARVEVEDTGIGIPPEHLAHVFDRFYQSGDAGSRLQPGTGIGLALVNDLTRLHGGHLEVHSTPGAGTTFSVILPLTETVAAAGPAAAEDLAPAIAVVAPAVDANAPAADDDRTTVMVVDDHAELRAHLRVHLASAYRVLEAADGLAALTLARERLPDLIVADVSMPGLDGYGLCAEIRRDPDLEGVPVILLTARAGLEDRLEGLRAAADDYLTKPFDAAELLLRVGNLIALRRRLQRRFQQEAELTKSSGGMIAVSEWPGVFPAREVAANDNVQDAWRRRLFATIDGRMADEQFKVGELAEAMGLDRTQLFRRVREETGMAPSDLLRERRLARAAELLRADAVPIAEIAYAVGFASVAYFTKCFRERHGVTPGKFRMDGEAVPSPRLA